MAELTISTKDLINAEKGMALIAGTGITPKGAYALRRARAAIAAEMKLYHEQRLELARQHAKKDAQGQPRTKIVEEKGKPVEVYDMEDQAAFDAALAEIQTEPVTLAGVRPVTLSEFGDANVSELAMTLLGPLVVDEEPAA